MKNLARDTSLGWGLGFVYGGEGGCPGGECPGEITGLSHLPYIMRTDKSQISADPQLWAVRSSLCGLRFDAARDPVISRATNSWQLKRVLVDMTVTRS